mmetsp:Transcript_22766/g.49521  ORF Transcript_22766/g.49521 Transcript_22766/m.49521 type:complete len:348 (+) Transcript_22766:2950-3993(+)
MGFTVLCFTVLRRDRFVLAVACLEKPGSAGLHGFPESFLGGRLGSQLGRLFDRLCVDRKRPGDGTLGPLQNTRRHDETLVFVDHLDRPPYQPGEIDQHLRALYRSSYLFRCHAVAKLHQLVQLVRIGFRQRAPVVDPGHGRDAQELGLAGVLQEAADGLLRAFVVQALYQVLDDRFGHSRPAARSQCRVEQGAAAAIEAAAAQQQTRGRKIGNASRAAARQERIQQGRVMIGRRRRRRRQQRIHERRELVGRRRGRRLSHEFAVQIDRLAVPQKGRRPGVLQGSRIVAQRHLCLGTPVVGPCGNGRGIVVCVCVCVVAGVLSCGIAAAAILQDVGASLDAGVVILGL